MAQNTNGKIEDECPPVIPLEGSSFSKNERVNKLKAFFMRKYDQEPEFFIRVPGRLVYMHVNLIISNLVTS